LLVYEVVFDFRRLPAPHWEIFVAAVNGMDIAQNFFLTAIQPTIKTTLMLF